MSTTLFEMLNSSCSRKGSSRALIFNDKTWSYRQFVEQVDLCAAGLRNHGVKQGDRFALVMRNCPEFIILYFALIKIGAIAVPVNFLLKKEELAYIFEHAEVVGAAAQKLSLSSVLEAGKASSGYKFTVMVGGDDAPNTVPFNELLQRGPDDNPYNASPDDTAMIIYTSGTTGKPKGVMLTHRNLTSNVESCRKAIDVSERDTFLCLLPMFHSFAWTTCVLLPLALGSTIVVMESIQPFGDVIKRIRQHKVNVFIAVPPIFAALSKIPFWWPLRLVNPIRICVSGAAPLPSGVLEKFEKKFGLPLLEGYGLTETSPVVSLNPLRGKRKPGTVGIPIPGVEVKFTNENGEEVPGNTVGEVCVRGSNVMSGYFKQPDATKEAFYPDGWLRTGDLGQIDDEGYIKIVDRLKDLIIVKGLNVYPKEVEEIILSHPDVAEAAVIGIPDDTGDETVKAFITAKDGREPDKSSISRFCRERLAPYKCPREIVVVSELPKNAIGKVLKRELRMNS